MRVEMSAILVVEDEPAVQLLLSTILEDAGYRVVTAASGQEALRVLDHHTIDLILVDIFMPGMDGLELISHLRRTSPYCKIIAMSGGTDEWNYLDVASQLGAKTTLQKPFTGQELLRAVRAHVPSPGPNGIDAGLDLNR